jgi:hypothetical protein
MLPHITAQTPVEGAPRTTEAIVPSPPLPCPSPIEPPPPPLEIPRQYSPLPPAPPQKTLPSFANLLNSPPQETARPFVPKRQNTWPDPLSPTPVLPRATSALPLPPPDFEHESARVQSPSNVSEVSRSQSRADYYSMGGPPSTYGTQPLPAGPMRDDLYYRENPRSHSIPPGTRYMSSPQSTAIPPVRLAEQSPLSQASQYFPSPRYEAMPPPISHESSYSREPYSRPPAQSRTLTGSRPSPLLPPSNPPPSIGTTSREHYYPREPDRRVSDPRYPAFREEIYAVREEGDYYPYETDPYARERPYERTRTVHPSENEVSRERDRVLTRESEREVWNRERYPEDYPSQRNYAPPPPRPRSVDRPLYHPRDYAREEWERVERERMELDTLERERSERNRFDRERWSRR